MTRAVRASRLGVVVVPTGLPQDVADEPSALLEGTTSAGAIVLLTSPVRHPRRRGTSD